MAKPTTPIFDSGHSIASGLVHSYYLDGSELSSITDDVTGSNTLVKISSTGTPASGTSAHGDALFNAGDSFVDTSADFSTSGDISLMVVFRTRTASFEQNVYPLWLGAADNDGCGVKTNTTPAFRIFPNDTTGIGTGSTVGNTTQYNIIITLSASSSPGAVMYLNGSSDATSATARNTETANMSKFGIGINNATTPNAFEADYDLLCGWNRILTGGEISSLNSDPFVFYRGSEGSIAAIANHYRRLRTR